MPYYMLTDETVNGEKYKFGINKREKPFEFYDMDLFISLNKPVMWVRKVEVPKGVKIVEEYLDDYNDMYTRYSANEIILRSKKSLTLKNLNFLINIMNVDISVGDYNILHWAIVNNHPRIFKELIRYIDPRENIMSRLYNTASKYKKQSIINILDIKVNKTDITKHVCDHCKYPISKDGFHITINEINDINSDLNSGCYYHQTCVIPAVELNVIKNYCKEIER
ncbi:hypothetical protein HN385_08140 [archaeon]|nr:hypothetical protein [archaeon]